MIDCIFLKFFLFWFREKKLKGFEQLKRQKIKLRFCWTKNLSCANNILLVKTTLWLKRVLKSIYWYYKKYLLILYYKRHLLLFSMDKMSWNFGIPVVNESLTVRWSVLDIIDTLLIVLFVGTLLASMFVFYVSLWTCALCLYVLTNQLLHPFFFHS